MRIAEKREKCRPHLDLAVDNQRRESRGAEESGTIYRCRVCRYTSDRRFNVSRHESRIHQNKIRRKCCGIKITSKGEWYEHCETVHPGRRLSTVTSKTKYKIFGNDDLKSLSDISDTDDKSDVSWSPIKRRSSERLRQLMKKPRAASPTMDQQSDFDADATVSDLDADATASDLDADATAFELDADATIETEEIPEKPDDPIVFKSPNVLQGVLTENYNHNIHVNNQAVSVCYSSNVSSSSSSVWSMENTRNIENFYQINPVTQQLPPKKKILRKFLNNNNLMLSEKENFDPIVKRVIVKETSHVKIERQVQISWHEITERHRAYLGSFDFDRYKV